MERRVWAYSEVAGEAGPEVLALTNCMFCGGLIGSLEEVTRSMKSVRKMNFKERKEARRRGIDQRDPERYSVVSYYPEDLELWRCASCGWWRASSEFGYHPGGHGVREIGYGKLRFLDPSDKSEPLEAVRDFLMARYDMRFSVDPRRFEMVVESIFRDLGYCTRITGYSGDGGIDVFLDGPNDSLIGVQVKRWKNAVKVEQVNALTGALMVNGCTKGIFVTTSRFQPAATSVARIATARGLPVELWDAERLFDALGIAQVMRKRPANDVDAPWMSCRLPYWHKYF